MHSNDCCQVQLSSDRYFAQGSKRICFVHPHKQMLCIKIMKPEGEGRFVNENNRDIKDYLTLERMQNSELFDHIPKFYGTINTNLGEGLLLELIRDGDGKISQSLGDLIRMEGMTAPLKQSLRKLKSWQIRQNLFTTDTGPHNVVVQKITSSNWKLFYIEGFLNKRFSFLIKYCTSFSKFMIRREQGKFDRRLNSAL
jgi:hypothetical protein